MSPKPAADKPIDTKLDCAGMLLGCELEEAIERAWKRHGLELEPAWAPEFSGLLKKTFKLGFTSAMQDAVLNLVKARGGQTQ